MQLTLTLTFANLPGGWSITWNRASFNLAAGATIDAFLTLTIPSSAAGGAYNWDVTVTGTNPSA